MDDLPFLWYNLDDHDHHHHHHRQEQSFDFDSENMFLNPSIHQLSPTNWTNQADFDCIDRFKDTKNVISISTGATATATATPPECLISGTNSNNIVVGNNSVSSGDSVTKEIDDGAVSQCSSEKRPATWASPQNPKRPRSNSGRPASSNINFRQPGDSFETDMEAVAQMKEMIYREAAFRPVSFAAETVVEKPKRKNVRISSDPQTVAARQRRERISERIRVLQKLVPGGNKMDTASMLDEAANYLKFLRSQVKALEQNGATINAGGTTINAGGTSVVIRNNNPLASMVVPFSHNPFSMQTHFHYPHENL